MRREAAVTDQAQQLAEGSAGGEDLAVVVVNYGSHALLEKNLVPLSTALPTARVVVVDNFTTVREAQAVGQLVADHGWHAVYSHVNSGFGAGVNLGASRAIELGAAALLLLNPDARIDAESVLDLRRLVLADPDVLAAPRILRSDGSVWFEGVDLLLKNGRMRSRARRPEGDDARFEPWLTGACLMVSRDLWLRLGGFDDEYFLYWEDVDLSHRAVALGGRLVVDSHARATHDDGGTQGRVSDDAADRLLRRKSPLYYYFNTRNRLVFASKNLTERDLLRWTWNAAPAGLEILLQGGRRQFLHPVAPLRAALRGTAAGLAIGWRARLSARFRLSGGRRVVQTRGGRGVSSSDPNRERG